MKMLMMEMQDPTMKMLMKRLTRIDGDSPMKVAIAAVVAVVVALVVAVM